MKCARVKVIFLNALSACANHALLASGKLLHINIMLSGLDSDIVLITALVNMYAKCRSLKDAKRMFDRMLERDVVAWSAIIAAYAQNRHGKEALELLDQMQLEGMIPNKVTFISIFDACARQTSLIKGKQMHIHIKYSRFQDDIVIATALLNMYGKFGSLEDARKTFDEINTRDVVCWTAMIAAYAQHEHSKEAIQLFDQMQLEGALPNKVTFVSLVSACASLTVLARGKKMHTCITHTGCESDIVVANALINMYSKCGNLKDAQGLFDKMQEHDVVSWNAMMDALAEHGHVEEALQLYEQMQQEGGLPNEVTYICLLSACASQGAIFQGKRIHTIIRATGFESDVDIMNALLNMYGKSGSLEDAQRTFDNMHERDIVSWNAAIAVCAQHGHGKAAFQILNQMQQEGLSPDEVTFISILSAFSHAGMVDEGRDCLISMSQEYGLRPTAKHYDCFIDLLGRAGQLDEAEDVINSTLFQPTSVTWISLLGACKNLVDVRRGELAANHIFALDPQEHSPYVMLANIYAAVGKWNDADRVLNRMRTKGQQPVCSSDH